MLLPEIIIERGGNPKPKVLPNGDKYDSTIYIKNKPQYPTTYNFVNTDYSKNAGKGGILAEGNYAGICAVRKSGKKAIWLFKKDAIDKVKSLDNLTEDIITLPSLTENPNHSNKKIMQWILIHNGGYNSDLSAGCITIHPDDATSFFMMWTIGEKMLVTLNRSPWYNEKWLVA